jgi:hypothetical protein
MNATKLPPAMHNKIALFKRYKAAYGTESAPAMTRTINLPRLKMRLAAKATKLHNFTKPFPDASTKKSSLNAE